MYPGLSITKKEAIKKEFKSKERPARACTNKRRRIYRYKSIIKKQKDSLLAQKNEKFRNVLGNVMSVMVGCTISTSSPGTPSELFDHHVHDRKCG